MNKVKVMNLLGLAQRAGKLVTGEELSIKEIRAQKAQLVLVANDAGKNTHKKVLDKSTYYEVPCFDSLTAEEITHAIGKPRMVVCVMDQGFAKKLKELIQG